MHVCHVQSSVSEDHPSMSSYKLSGNIFSHSVTFPINTSVCVRLCSLTTYFDQRESNTAPLLQVMHCLYCHRVVPLTEGKEVLFFVTRHVPASGTVITSVSGCKSQIFSFLYEWKSYTVKKP